MAKLWTFSQGILFRNWCFFQELIFYCYYLISKRAKIKFYNFLLSSLSADIQGTEERLTENISLKKDELIDRMNQIEASNLETFFIVFKTIEGMGEQLLKRVDGKVEELFARINQIEASNIETFFILYKNVQGMGERLLKRIDEKIEELISRQDKFFNEMTMSRSEQSNTVNVFKRDAEDLIFKVNEVSEKILDFETNKRNNLILLGLPNDPHETPTTLDSKVRNNTH